MSNENGPVLQIIAARLGHLEDKQDRIDAKLDDLHVCVEHRLTKVETRAAIQGAIAGAVAAVLTALATVWQALKRA